MEISTWVIVSWVFVAIMTGVNIFVFLKLKSASEQMMKSMFPGAKDMNEAVGQMQAMMNNLGPGGLGGVAQKMQQVGSKRSRGRGGARGGNPSSLDMARNSQLKAAMDKLQKIQKPK